MLEMPWAERVMNEEVLDKIVEQRQVWKDIQSRRDEMFRT